MAQPTDVRTIDLQEYTILCCGTNTGRNFLSHLQISKHILDHRLAETALFETHFHLAIRLNMQHCTPHAFSHMELAPEVLDIFVKELLDHNTSVGVWSKCNVHTMIGDGLDNAVKVHTSFQLVRRANSRILYLSIGSESRWTNRNVCFVTSLAGTQHAASNMLTDLGETSFG